MKKIFILAILAVVLVGCKEEGAELRPGVYVDTDLIDAFAGKEIRISGQASCFTGLQSVAIRCEAWKINETTDLTWQKPVVWNFDYTLVVPDDAKFPQDLIVTATDVHGSEMKKAITMRYVPATTAPYVAGLQKQIAVLYDEEAGVGVFTLKTTLYGEDRLQEAVLDIPDVKVHKTFALDKREEEVQWSYSFEERGSYPMTLTVTDRSGNVTVSEHKLVVMLPEKLDEISDYPYMFAFKSNSNEADYVFGFYQYMKRLDSYQYEVYVYAESDETAFMFSPKQETNGERKFGESPLVEGRIISVQSQPEYVQGYKPGKGYWGLWIDIRDNVIAQWALDNSEADQTPLYYSADWNKWTFTPMQAGETPYQQVGDITIYKGNQYFCFATATDWTHIWRCWKADGGEMAGWWFSEDGGGDGATLPTIKEDTPATISFDTAIKWCYIIKK
ncbi:MAG: hypothetical protein J5612_00360 [Paludibacteraceae bacterium]|nr:hypothetical protein [Paludibacteraceae bacterium]